MEPPEREPNRQQRRAFSTFEGPVESAGDPESARALTRLFSIDADLSRALTHGFHSYAGRMHPTIARGAIARWSQPGARILDPFCGSGTVLVEAYAAGRAAIGVDASPLAVRLASVRSRTLTEDGREKLVDEARAIGEEAAERARKRQRPDIPAWARNEAKRFHPHVVFELLGLRDLVMATAEDDLGWALRMCLSSLLVKFMRTGPTAPRDGEDKRIARGLPSTFFARRALELARGLETLAAAAPKGTAPPVVRLGDARAYPEVGTGTVDLVVSSPPYAGTFDYAEQHEVRFLWLGLPRRKFLDRQLGERGQGLGAAPEAWETGRQRWLAETARALRPGGHVVMVVGDGVVGNFPEDAAAAVARDGGEVGLRFLARASQERPPRDRRLRDIFGTTRRYEHIVLLRREPDAPRRGKPVPGPRGPAPRRPGPRGPAPRGPRSR